MVEGWIDPAVASEFRELRLWQTEIEVVVQRSDRGIRERLRLLGERVSGAQAMAMRSQPIHHAHRVFFRNIGLEPDRHRPPAEELTVARLKHGGFRSQNSLLDALTIATVETGVGVWALNADGLRGDLGIRTASEGEPVARVPLPAGRLVIADRVRAVAVLFGDIAPELEPPRGPMRARLFAVQVGGVPWIHIEEALWLAAEAAGPELSA
jgi:DNA/RNA-binding domain of Phe-tRNA-synthetase-like protein